MDTEEEKLAKKAEIATNAVIGTVANGIGRGVAMLLGAVILFAVVVIGAPAIRDYTPEQQNGLWLIFGIGVFCYLVYLGWRHIRGPKGS